MLTDRGLTWRGDITVTVTGPSGLEVVNFPNLITDAGLDHLAAALGGDDVGEITYVALGSSATAPTAGDTDLGAEEYRKAVTSHSAGLTGIMDTIVVVPAPDATGFTIREIGWFGGSAASISSGSGTLIARVLYERTKTTLESIQIDRTDTLGRA